ncbi:MAG: hypothetical protein ABH879_10880 [archaeon]
MLLQDRFRVLSGPENSRILTIYEGVECEGMDHAVYEPLARRYRSLRQAAELSRGSDHDPVSYLGRLIGMEDAMQSQAAQLRQPERPEAERELGAIFTDAADAFSAYAQHRETALYRLWDAMNAVATEMGSDLESIAQDIRLHDKVIPAIWPLRSDAEAAVTEALSAQGRIDSTLTRAVDFAKKHPEVTIGIDSQRMPTAKASEALQKAIIQYNHDRFDRIY